MTENDTGRESLRFLIAQLADTPQVSFSLIFDPLRHRRRWRRRMSKEAANADSGLQIHRDSAVHLGACRIKKYGEGGGA